MLLRDVENRLETLMMRLHWNSFEAFTIIYRVVYSFFHLPGWECNPLMLILLWHECVFIWCTKSLIYPSASVCIEWNYKNWVHISAKIRGCKQNWSGGKFWGTVVTAARKRAGFFSFKSQGQAWIKENKTATSSTIIVEI